MNEQFVITKLNEFLEKKGFRFSKSKMLWWKKNEHNVWQLVHFQRSQWGTEYYLNLGIYFEEFQNLKSKPPKFTDMHLRQRYENLNILNNADYLRLFTREGTEHELESKIETITRGLERILPLMIKLTDYTYLVKQLSKDSGDVDGFSIMHFPPETYKEFIELQINKKRN